jgi:hypothetical protein
MNFTAATLDQLTVHYTGNKQNGQSLLLSGGGHAPGKEVRIKISEALLSRWPNCHERYAFTHPSSLDFNEVYQFVKTLFAEPSDFHAQSVKIATHLYESSLHPKIKPGELYVTYFSNILIEDRPVDAIGLFKAETRSLFAEVDPRLDSADADVDLEIRLKEGVELSRIDKGCLILNQEADQGFELLIYDTNGKGEEAQYWKDKFLGVLIRQNEFAQTQGFLTITKNYVTKHLPGEFDVSKTEQIDILNRSMEYFKTHDSFNKSEFETEVLHHDDLIQSFRKYDEQYRENNALDQVDEFDISRQAVKKQARVFKSVLKLDKNFHIYIHGDRELIEKGYDEKLQKQFYKIYFDLET